MVRSLRIFAIVVLFGCIACRPIKDTEPTDPLPPLKMGSNQDFLSKLLDLPVMSEWGDNHHVDYLQKYGYYQEPSKLNVDSVVFSRLKNISIETALKAFQRMYGLNETGTVTKETVDLMRMPRCGFPDVRHHSEVDLVRKKRYNIQSRNWAKKGNVISYRVNNFNNDGLSHAWQLWAIRVAYDKWKNACRLDFWRYSDKLPVDMDLWHGGRRHLNCPFSFDGRGGILAHAFNPGNGDGGDVHIDIEDKWDTFHKMTRIFAHEIGHGLGIGHSAIKEALMNPYPTFPGNWELTNDDVRAIQDIYGRRG